MKKTFFTISFVALLAVMTNAQSTDQAAPRKAQEPKKESVNPDGTVGIQALPAQAQPADTKGQKTENPQPVQTDRATQTDPAQPKKDRHAITEKGVPASKSKTAADQKPAEHKKTPAAQERK